MVTEALYGKPDVTKLNLSTLISNMMYATAAHELEYRKECMQEIDRRFPMSSQVLETVEGEKSSPLKTQNFVAPTNFADEQPLHTIEVDFEDIWNLLCEATKYIESPRMKSRLFELANMFQNPAIIKPINWMAD